MFGIPNLLSGVVKNAPTVLLAGLESKLLDLISPAPTWGVYLSGTTDKAFAVDSVLELTVSRDSPTSDYRIEAGSFATYNKVQKALNVPLRLSVAGSELNRNAFLAWLEKEVSSIDTFDILTPETLYPSMTLTSYKIHRSAQRGAAKIDADCIFVEVREVAPQFYNSGTPTTDTTNAASPDDQPSTPTAMVQPTSINQSAANTAGSVQWA